MSSLGAPDLVTGTEPVAHPAAASAPRPHDRRDPRVGTGPDGVTGPPLAGQPGHGPAAFLRNQPARIVDGRIQGGYNDVYELICPSCGDRPDLDYLEVPPRLRWLRGPRTLEEGLAAYHGHLGLPWPARIAPEASGPD